MGKYDEVNKSLRKEEKPRSERVREFMSKLGASKSTELALKFSTLRKKKKELEEHVSKVNEEIEAVSALIELKFEEEGISSMKIRDTGESVRVRYEPVISYTDKELFRQWCIENGYEKEMFLHSGTANTILKEALLAGAPVPPGTEPFLRTKFTLAKK